MALRFLNPRQPRSIDEMSPLQQEQLRVAGKRYDGSDLPAAERLSPEREVGPDEGDEGGSFLGFLEIWDVEEDGVPRYEAYLYMSDSGTVFRRGTTEIVAERIQVYFQADGSAALGDALLEAYRAAQKEFSA
jgi:hypothetical protein